MAPAMSPNTTHNRIPKVHLLNSRGAFAPGRDFDIRYHGRRRISRFRRSWHRVRWRDPQEGGPVRDGRGVGSSPSIASHAGRIGAKRNPRTHWCRPWTTLASPIDPSRAAEAYFHARDCPTLGPASRGWSDFFFLNSTHGASHGDRSRGSPPSRSGAGEQTEPLFRSCGTNDASLTKARLRQAAQPPTHRAGSRA